MQKILNVFFSAFFSTYLYGAEPGFTWHQSPENNNELCYLNKSINGDNFSGKLSCSRQTVSHRRSNPNNELMIYVEIITSEKSIHSNIRGTTALFKELTKNLINSKIKPNQLYMLLKTKKSNNELLKKIKKEIENAK